MEIRKKGQRKCKLAQIIADSDQIFETFQFQNCDLFLNASLISEQILRKICTVQKISRFSDKFYEKIAHDPLLLDKVLILYRISLEATNFQTCEISIIQNDLSRFWEILRFQNVFEIAGSSFAILLAEIAGSFDGLFLGVLFQYLQNAKMLKLQATFQCLNRILSCADLSDKVEDEVWANVFHSIQNIFTLFEASQTKKKGSIISQIGSNFCCFLQSFLYFLEFNPNQQRQAVQQGLNLLTNRRMNQIILKILKKYNRLEIFYLILNLLLKKNHYYAVEQICIKIIYNHVDLIEPVHIVTLIEKNEQWAEQWSKKLFVEHNQRLVQAFIQSCEGMLVFNLLMQMNKLIDGEKTFEFLISIGYGLKVCQYQENNKLKDSVKRIAEMLLQNPEEMIDALYSS